MHYLAKDGLELLTFFVSLLGAGIMFHHAMFMWCWGLNSGYTRRATSPSLPHTFTCLWGRCCLSQWPRKEPSIPVSLTSTFWSFTAFDLGWMKVVRPPFETWWFCFCFLDSVFDGPIPFPAVGGVEGEVYLQHYTISSHNQAHFSFWVSFFFLVYIMEELISFCLLLSYFYSPVITPLPVCPPTVSHPMPPSPPPLSQRQCPPPPARPPRSMEPQVSWGLRLLFSHWGQTRQFSGVYVSGVSDQFLYTTWLVAKCLRDLKDLI